MTLKFIKTQMHSGRLQISWIPCNLPNVTPSLVTASFNKRDIIDIRTEDTISIELPYLLYSDYCPTVPISPTLEYSGQVDIIVLNDLRAPDTCSQSVDFQVFYSAGDDFELVAPSELRAGAAPYEAQSDGTELVRNSIKQGMELEEREIGGTNTTTDPLFHPKRCVGEKILSIKSYLLRNSVINYGNTFTFSTNSKYFIDPYFISLARKNSVSGVLQASSFVGDAFSFYAPCYAFMRGSVRITAYDATVDNGNLVTNSIVTNGIFGSQPVSAAATTRADFISTPSLATTSGVYPLTPCNVQENARLSYQHIPFYSRLPMALTTYYNGRDSPTTDPGRPLSTLKITNYTNFSNNFVLQRAVGDDFQFMFFVGCPPLLIS